jgi:hypothetical protein
MLAKLPSPGCGAGSQRAPAQASVICAVPLVSVTVAPCEAVTFTGTLETSRPALSSAMMFVMPNVLPSRKAWRESIMLMSAMKGFPT